MWRKVGDYAAAWGVLGGLKRRSFRESDLEEFKGKDPGFLKEVLKNYLEDDYPPREDIEYLERALYISHIKKTIKLLRFLALSVSKVLRILLLEFDILNLKLLIRSIILEINVSSDMFYWGYPYLVFKSKDPASFKNIEDLKEYLKREPLIKGIFIKAIRDFEFYKDIYHFDICLDKEYFHLLQKESLKIDQASSLLLQYFVAVKSLIYGLRLKFFQERDFPQIQRAVCILPLFDKEFFSTVFKTSSLEEALRQLEESSVFSKFKMKLSTNFEEDLGGFFYHRFLKRRSFNIFTLFPYLSFYLRQRYLIEKMIFIINTTFK